MHRGPASENLQGRKPRWGNVCRCRALDLRGFESCAQCQRQAIFNGRRPRMRTQLGRYGTDIANGDLSFRAACDFNELGVAKYHALQLSSCEPYIGEAEAMMSDAVFLLPFIDTRRSGSGKQPGIVRGQI